MVNVFSYQTGFLKAPDPKSLFQLKWFYGLLPSQHVISSVRHGETSLWK